MENADKGYYESTPKLEDRPSLYSATVRRGSYSDRDPQTGEYKYSDEQLLEIATYWQSEYEGEDYYSPRALAEMDAFIKSILFEYQSRQVVTNATREEIDSIQLTEV
jgi:hypothetical protein